MTEPNSKIKLLFTTIMAAGIMAITLSIVVNATQALAQNDTLDLAQQRTDSVDDNK